VRKDTPTVADRQDRQTQDRIFAYTAAAAAAATDVSLVLLKSLIFVNSTRSLFTILSFDARSPKAEDAIFYRKRTFLTTQALTT